MKEKQHLPLFGVGPIYGITIIVITIIGITMSVQGRLSSGQMKRLHIPFLAAGIAFIIFGITLWIMAAIVARVDTNIIKNQLLTSGVYAYVRNPLYSAFMFACTGALLCANNLWLLILPPVYWIFMTILMKNTEEKWLAKLYGEEYIRYCKIVNRCIPWKCKKE